MRLTARGVGLAPAGAVLLACGFLLGYRELALLGSAALLAVGFALGYAAWRPRLTVHREAAPDRVTRGQPSTVTLTVRNASRVRAATLVAYDRCGRTRVPVPLLRLRPGRDTVVSYPVPTDRRGVVPIGPLRVTRSDPLGLVSVARVYGDPVHVWVHPRGYPLSAVPAGVTRSLDGRMDRVPHGSITFATLRDYVVGDELRHVHWRTSARVGDLMVREHLDTSLPRLVVLLDDRAASWPDPAGFEAACEAAASVVAAAAREDLPVVLHLVHGPPAAGHPRHLLDRLAEADPTTPRDAAVRDARDAAGRDASESPPGRIPAGTATRATAGDPLAATTARLRQSRSGDTLVYLTGAGGVADLGQVAGLRGTYPAVVVGVLGGQAPAPATVRGVLVLEAADGAEFAAAWDGVRSW